MTDVDREQTIDLIRLSLVHGIGPILAKNLISYCRGIESVFDRSRSKLESIPGLGSKLITSLRDPQHLVHAQNIYSWCLDHDVRVVGYLDDAYPARLRHHKDMPIVLYVRGLADLNPKRTIGIVGTRGITEYGRRCAERIVRELAPYQVVVVSGLAYGVDITAHRQALKTGLTTWAILGHGLDQIYPKHHARTAKDIRADGALISELIPGKGPDREHFPMRNRIIAGLSDFLLVVESKNKGGSMITAEFALGYYKDVGAVPGRLGDEQSEGCLSLIKKNKASLVSGGKDIADIMAWSLQSTQPRQRKMFTALSPEQGQIMRLIDDAGTMSMDEISYETQKSTSIISKLLLEMELEGLIKSMPGKRYAVL